MPRDAACGGNWLRGRVIDSDRMREVSRRHSRYKSGEASEALQSRKTEKRICRTAKLVLKARTVRESK